jgi:hypothetical protein
LARRRTSRQLTLNDSTLVAVRGARIAELPAKNWFDVDKLSGHYSVDR